MHYGASEHWKQEARYYWETDDVIRASGEKCLAVFLSSDPTDINFIFLPSGTNKVPANPCCDVAA